MHLRRVAAGFLGATAVALGAFGAHGLKAQLALIPEAAGWWATASQYLLLHAIAVGAIDCKGSATLWSLGAVIFAATLYALALGAPRWLGAITPVGGALLIAGWLVFAWTSRKQS